MRRTKIWEGHPKARAKAEAAEKELWVGQVVALLREMGVDALAEAAQQVDPEASLRRVCSHLRGPTLRGHVQAWKSYWSWWMACGGTSMPTKPTDVTRYLEIRAAGACTASVIKRTVAALRFFELAACIHPDRRIGKDAWLHAQSEALIRERRSEAREPRQAPRPPLAMLLGLEQYVVQELNPTVLRCYAWWKLVSCWGTLRYDDHRGFEPTKLKLNGKGALVTKLTRTKTTGKDKKVQCRLLVVAGEAYLAEDNWLCVGLALWKETAPWERDFLLPVADRGSDEVVAA